MSAWIEVRGEAARIPNYTWADDPTESGADFATLSPTRHLSRANKQPALTTAACMDCSPVPARPR